jgi:ketosteroid isomerase-like protein
MTTAASFVWVGCVVSVRLPAGSGNIPMESDKNRIQQTIDCFVRAYNAGDLAGLMNVYADDFVDMSDGQSTLQGAVARGDNALRLRDTFAKFNGHLTVHIEQIETAGDWAFDRGVLRVELHPKAGGPPVLVERRMSRNLAPRLGWAGGRCSRWTTAPRMQPGSRWIFDRRDEPRLRSDSSFWREGNSTKGHR